MSYLWFEWVQNDKLSKICKDAKNVPRKNASTSNGKMVIDVKKITIKMNVVDVNVAIRNKIIEEHVLQERKPQKKNYYRLGGKG